MTTRRLTQIQASRQLPLIFHSFSFLSCVRFTRRPMEPARARTTKSNDTEPAPDTEPGASKPESVHFLG